MRKSTVFGFSRIFPLIVISAVALLLVLTPLYYKKSTVKATNLYDCEDVATNVLDSTVYNVLTNYTHLDIITKYGEYASPGFTLTWLSDLKANQFDRIGASVIALHHHHTYPLPNDHRHSSIEYWYDYTADNDIYHDFVIYDPENALNYVLTPFDEAVSSGTGTGLTWASSEAQEMVEDEGEFLSIGPQLHSSFKPYFPSMYSYVSSGGYWLIQCQNGVSWQDQYDVWHISTPGEFADWVEDRIYEVENGSQGTAPFWCQIYLDRPVYDGTDINDYIEAIYDPEGGSIVDGMFIVNSASEEGDIDKLENALDIFCEPVDLD